MKVSVVANVGWTADGIRRKWQVWASVVKQKELSRQKSARKTGGEIEEKPIVLTAIELPPQKKQKVQDDVEVPPVSPELSQPPWQPPPVGIEGLGLQLSSVPVGLQLQASGAQRSMPRTEASQLIGRNPKVMINFLASCRRARATPMARKDWTTPVAGETADIVDIECEQLVLEKEHLDVEKE